MAFYVHVIFCLTFVLSLLSVPSQCSDPSPLQDFCIADLNSSIFVNGFPCKDPTTVTSDDFFFNGFNVGERVFNLFGVNFTRGTAPQFPGLNTNGISMVRIEFLPGGVNPPHTHPRASELVLMAEGRVLAGFVTTDNVLFFKVLTPGMLFVIPQALLHFQINLQNESALLFANFNSQIPGNQIQSLAHFNTTPPIPDEVLRKAFNVNQTVIDILKSALSVPLVSKIYEMLPFSGY